MNNENPSQALLRKKLDYDPETGKFVWKGEPSFEQPWAGKPAGTVRTDGRPFIGVDNFRQIGSHRLAWIYSFGDIPDGMEVDHRDCDPSNNRLDNLRLATSSQQKMNRRVQTNSKSGLKGAYYHSCHKGKKWRSQIKTADKRIVFLGYFHTPEEAHEAYKVAAPIYHGEFARV